MIGGKRGFGQLRSEKAAEVAIEDAHSNLSRNALGRQGAQVAEQHEPDSEDESRDHKRLRLAREYLERIGAGTKPSDGSDAVAAKLDADADLETQAGVREIALDLVGTVWADRARFMKGHDLPPTCVASWSPSSASARLGSSRLGVQAEMQISSASAGDRTGARPPTLPPAGAIAVTGSKDCTLWVWDLASGRRERWAGRRRTRADAAAVVQARGGRLPTGALADAARKGYGPAAGLSAGKQALQMGVVDFDGPTAALPPAGLDTDGGTESSDPSIPVGRSAGSMSSEDRARGGHFAAVRAVSISSDGAMVASGGDDFTVRLWKMRVPGSGLGSAVGSTGTVSSSSVTGAATQSSGSKPVSAKSKLGAVVAAGARRKGKGRAVASSALGRYRPEYTLRSHSASVTGLAFSPDAGSGLLLSAGADRKVLHWEARERVQMEALFGHAAAPGRVDVCGDGRAVSAGGRERTIRLWKLKEQSQLVFRAPAGCEAVDVVSMVHPGGGLVLSGSHDGRLLLWSQARRRPVAAANALSPDYHVQPLVTLADSQVSDDECVLGSGLSLSGVGATGGPGSRRAAARSAAAGDCGWVTAIAWLRGTDIVATAAGASRGIVLWRAGRPRKDTTPGGASSKGADAVADEADLEETGAAVGRRLEAIGHIPCRGFVNGLSFTPCGRYLTAAVGTEHWAGRWWRMKHSEAKNGLLVVAMPELAWESTRKL